LVVTFDSAFEFRADGFTGLMLYSAQRRQLNVPPYQPKSLGRRAFPVAEPTVWNSLPDELRDETENTFRHSLKTLLFRQY